MDYFKIQGGLIIKNAIKNGLDTSRLVNLIICFDHPDNFKIKGFQFPPNLFFIHEISFNETVGILINEFKFDREKAISRVKEWRNEFRTTEIKRDEISKDYEKIVEKTNQEIVKEKGNNYKIGDNDIIIIAGFMKEKVNIVHVKDKGFEETCKRLGMNIIPTPKRDLEGEKEFKKSIK